MNISYMYKIKNIILCLLLPLCVKAQKQDSISIIIGQAYHYNKFIQVDTTIRVPLLAKGTIEIPKTMKLIGDFSLSGTENIKHVNIPNNVEVIGVGAFDGCSKLVAVNLEQENNDGTGGLKEISYCAFYKCKRLKNITLPSTLKHIDESAFYGCI